MNNIVYKLFFLLVTLVLSINSTFAIEVQKSNSIIGDCSGADVRADYYIPNGASLSIYPIDLISAISKPLYIRDTETTVVLWENTSGIMTCGDWWRVSNAVPAISGNDYLAVGGDACAFNNVKKTNNLLPSAQIVYKVAYKKEIGLDEGISDYYYYKNGDSTQYLLADQTKRIWGDVIYHDNECFNIYTHWCGDGVLDSSDGEKCDDGNNINGDGCSATCTIEPAPYCGDGTKNGTEQCDYNDASKEGWGDATPGCDTSCKVINEPRTYCGDGIIQRPNYYGVNEQCDDGNNINGDGCDSTCNIEETCPACCEVLLINPHVGDSPLTSNFVCVGQNTDTYKIEIKNDLGNLIETINSRTGDYTFSEVGDYSARCYVDEIISSDRCAGNISVTTPEPTYCVSGGITGVQDQNIYITTANLCQAGEVVGDFSAIRTGDTTNYTWSCDGLILGNCDASYERPVVINYCGDGTVQTPNDDGVNEQCDDGNNIDLDGCDSTCTIEIPTICESGGVTGVLTHKVYITTPDLCQAGEVVGDFSAIRTGDTTNYTWSCDGLTGGNCDASYERPVVMNYCGDGTIQTPNDDGVNEQCDDGNNVDGDGCSAVCTIEVVMNYCGDGIIQNPNDDGENEQCDDGNNINGDGCDSMCNIETVEECVSGGITGLQSSRVSVTTTNLCESGKTVGDFISTTSGRTTNYTWNCDGLTGGSCYASYTTSGGGSIPTCYDIKVSGANITCVGNSKTNSLKLDCGNGDELIKRAVDGTFSTREATFTCDYSITPRTSSPRCYVSGLSTVTDPDYVGWSTRLACLHTYDPYCGDGVLQAGEDCERVINEDGTIGDFPDICDSNCKFNGGDGGGGGGGGGGGTTTTPGGVGVFTIPNHGDIIFGPSENMIVGHRVNPFRQLGEKPYIYNNSDYDLSFDKLCVKYKDGNSLDYTTGVLCKTMPEILYPGQKVEFDSYPNYIGNKEKVALGHSYGINRIVTTIKTNGRLYEDAFFAANLNVRVSRPSIVTSGGGTSYIGDTSKISNINIVAITAPEKNKNFVGVGVSSNTTSSFSANTTDSDVIDEVKNEGTDYDSGINDIINEGGPTTSTTNNIADFENYNGIENVFILKNKNFRVDYDVFSTLTGPRTYIIENANLYIDYNITYPKNIAFVVKGGNIIIDKDVVRLDGTYISIEKDGVGGFIISEPSGEILKVNGSLYGDITDLVDNRYKVEELSNGQLSVGTIVSFGSSLFRKPAPLVSEFITEYMNLQKVAK